MVPAFSIYTLYMFIHVAIYPAGTESQLMGNASGYLAGITKKILYNEKSNRSECLHTTGGAKFVFLC